jgi:ribosomal protein S18 acetylase RimI-like enzyme
VTGFVVRKLTATEWPLACAVVRELRPNLNESEFLARTARMTAYGYELVAALDSAGVVVGIVGYRPLETYSLGWHLHVDDLATAAACQGQGVGTALLDYAEKEAAARGMASVYLDSRPTAEGFYLSRRYLRHPPFPMKKAVVSNGDDP